MSDIGSDKETQLYMMRDAYRELRAKDPNHELLGLAELHQDEGGFNFTPEYQSRCVRDGDRWRVQGYARYTFALQAAVEGVPIRLLGTNPPCDF